MNRKTGGLSEHTTGPLPLLFDLQLDPGEAYDLSGKYPDVAAQLAERMVAWEDDLRHNRTGRKN